MSTRSSVAQFQFWEISELGNSLPPPAWLSQYRCPTSMRIENFCGPLTGRNENSAASHDAAHLLTAIAPPIGYWSDIAAQMSLAFVLDVEAEDVIREIFPLRSIGKQLVLVLENVCETIVEVIDWRRILVPPCHIVLCCRCRGAINGRKLVLGDVCVCKVNQVDTSWTPGQHCLPLPQQPS